MIYRLTSAAEWVAAQVSGEFRSADLAAEGFIHCSEREQILRTANKYFAEESELTLLLIDEPQLGDTLVREDLTGGGTFPHVYAPIPIVAVVAAYGMYKDARGDWILPVALGV
jgi:uncharacterized protein (DUF952 family)